MFCTITLTTLVLVLFSLLALARPFSVVGYPDQTVCVVASKAGDGYYDFSLESDIPPWKLDYDFLIPAATWFNQALDDLGMAFQTIKTSEQFDDRIQAYWAGFLELYVSRNMTCAHFENTFGGFCKDNSSAACQELRSHVRRNLEMTIKKSLQSGDIDPYWHQMELLLWQLRGIQDAWNNVMVHTSRVLTSNYLMQLLDNVFDIYLLQVGVEMGDISSALGLYEELERGPNGRMYFAGRPSCSAFVKLAPDHKDIFISHNTWQDYENMLKVIKYYEFAWRLTRDPASPLVPTDKILLSSYPSTISSIDDFYVTSSGLVIQETTNGNDNSSLWPFVRHGLNTSVLEVFRVMIANRLARTPSEWISFFSRENSGTYNNQWMVVDTKLFNSSKPLPENDLFWVAEQIPGFVQSADVTDHLVRNSYWGSYNNPYFEFIHAVSGFDELEGLFGEYFSYDMTPRAQIFRRDHAKAVSVADVYRLMRYNDFTHDPLSSCNCTPPYSAQCAISARSDLNDLNGTYPLPQLGYRLHGATDVKIVNLKMARSLSMIAVAGPTYDKTPVFEWSRVRPNRPRPQMHPERWDFPPVLIRVENNGAVPQSYMKIRTINP